MTMQPTCCVRNCGTRPAWLVDAVLPRRSRPPASRRAVITAVAVLAGSLVPLVSLALASPSPGRYPFRGDQVVFSVGVMIVLAAVARERLLRIAAALAVCASVVLFVVPNPLGGNFLRFTQFVVIPLAMVAFGTTQRRSTLPFSLVILVATAWSLQFGVVSTVAWSGDESIEERYHVPLVDEVQRRNAGARPLGRLEIPFTENHWEAFFVAAEVPVARGWERQVDLERNPELYDAGLTAAVYLDWVDRNAVRWIAVPDVDLDDGGGPRRR